MSKSTDICIKDAALQVVPLSFRAPLKFGGRVIEKTVLLNVEVVVESRDGKRRETGLGSMPVGNIWAWPTDKLSPDQTEAALKQFATEVVNLAAICREFGHPIDLVYHLSAEYEHLAKTVSQRLKLGESIPELGQLVAASPFDAALHDAYGRLHGLNSYQTLTNKFMNHDLSEYLDDQFAGEYLDQYILKSPQQTLPLYHLVGALDPLTAGENPKPIGDGLPETLEQWIPANGLTHLKIKLSGDDPQWDRQRILAVDQVAVAAQAKRGCTKWCYLLDFNERCANTAQLVELLEQLQREHSALFDRIQYVEQPLPRNLQAHRDQTVHAAAKLKPVVIDESLTDYDALLLSREMGYTGVALKACKGQSESLLLGAAAQKFQLFLCVQDLTCPGFSFLHSASLAAHLPVAAIEGNARQYCPSGNKPFVKRFPGMFEITAGTVQTGVLTGPGLGF